MIVYAIKRPEPCPWMQFHPDTPHPAIERDELGYYVISHKQQKRLPVSPGMWVNLVDQLDYYVVDDPTFQRTYQVLGPAAGVR